MVQPWEEEKAAEAARLAEEERQRKIEAGELDPDDAKYVEGDMETVVCQPNSGGCGWCKPLDYWAYALGEELPETWDCGTNTTDEANNVIKTGPELGGVLCCKDL